VRRDARGERGELVAAFEGRHHAVLRVAGRHGASLVGDPAVVRRGQAQLGKVVGGVAVETREMKSIWGLKSSSAGSQCSLTALRNVSLPAPGGIGN